MKKKDERFYWQTWNRHYRREAYTIAKLRERYMEKLTKLSVGSELSPMQIAQTNHPRVFVPVVIRRKAA
jgi:hypothetical protein